MNCQACRQQLEPFLDDELSVNENVSVLEHVTKCTACEDVFETEKRIRKSLREKLTRDVCPPEVAARAFDAIRAEAPGRKVWRWAAWAIPAAAAVIAAFLYPVITAEREDPKVGKAPTTVDRKGFSTERTHDHLMHGGLMHWAGERYDELVVDLAPDQVLNEAVLRRVEPRGRSIATLEEFEKVVKSKLGRSFNLPPGFVEGGRVVGGELLEWHEGLIQQVILEYGDREVSLYEISCCNAKKLGAEIAKLMASLRTVESDPGRQVTIAACQGCDAVLVLRNNRTYLLISRQGRDWQDEWLLARARKLMD
jgi:hypothetical protein